MHNQKLDKPLDQAL